MQQHAHTVVRRVAYICHRLQILQLQVAVCRASAGSFTGHDSDASNDDTASYNRTWQSGNRTDHFADPGVKYPLLPASGKDSLKNHHYNYYFRLSTLPKMPPLWPSNVTSDCMGGENQHIDESYRQSTDGWLPQDFPNSMEEHRLGETWKRCLRLRHSDGDCLCNWGGALFKWHLHFSTKTKRR
jgi:hypothetical protein